MTLTFTSDDAERFLCLYQGVLLALSPHRRGPIRVFLEQMGSISEEFPCRKRFTEFDIGRRLLPGTHTITVSDDEWARVREAYDAGVGLALAQRVVDVAEWIGLQR